MTEKRLTPRSLCADLVRLEWLDDSGEVQSIFGVLEDISPRGACLQVESPVPVNLNALVRRDEDWIVPCLTAYCVYREIGFYVGLVFDECKPWSEAAFQPQHLLDLNKLV